MYGFQSIQSKHVGCYIITIFVAIFIILPTKIPKEIASIVNTNIGKLAILVGLASMFVLHPIVGAVGIVAAYELIKRSTLSDNVARFVPTEAVKSDNLNKLNNFPTTVEEAVISQTSPPKFNRVAR